MSVIFEIMESLDKCGLYFTLDRTRSDTIRVCVTFVGERMEIDVFKDDHVEISRFYGNEAVEGGKELLDAALKI